MLSMGRATLNTSPSPNADITIELDDLCLPVIGANSGSRANQYVIATINTPYIHNWFVQSRPDGPVSDPAAGHSRLRVIIHTVISHALCRPTASNTPIETASAAHPTSNRNANVTPDSAKSR